MMNKYGWLTAGLIGAWFVFALTASARHLFLTAPGDPPLPLGLAAGLPIVLFLIWFGVSAGFRQFTLSLSPRILTLVQSWRIEGFVFVVLASYGILPKLFASSAGWGDMFIGVTALFVGTKLARPRHRWAFIMWQVLGIADLMAAVGLGTMAGLIHPHEIGADAMMVLPMSVIPTFEVPLFLILHMICIAQARRWPAAEPATMGATLQAPIT